MVCKRCKSENIITLLDNEVFKPCVGYEDYAQISNLGRVVMKERMFDNNGKRCYKPKRLATFTKTRQGYLTVTLHINGKTVRIFVHRLVAMAFIPNPENLPCVNHKDEVKTNNNVDNLEWCTREYNNNYGTRNERISIANKGNFTPKMGKHLNEVKDAMKTPVAQFDKDGHFIRAYESVCCAERELGIRIAYIFYRGKTCAKGFVFKHISKQCYVALAALRSDSHYMQWYTDGKEWYLYDREESNGVYAIFNDCHWATVEEIIEHFNK